MKDKPAPIDIAHSDSMTLQHVRKPYTSPHIVHELLLETRTVGSAPFGPSDPGMVDPPLPPKPGSPDSLGEGGGSIDPPLPPKPASSSSDSGGGGSMDPPLPPAPGKP